MILDEILKKHQCWLAHKEGGERANLIGANLRGANLRDADLENADLWGADLGGADLENANLIGANLRGANLRDADLENADLWGANLRGANLIGANLRGANLRDADLGGADLENADLWGVSGNRLEIKSIFVSENWPITYTSKILQIGCQRNSFEKWWAFSDSEIDSMDDNALHWWKENKDFIRSTVERFPAK